MTTAAQLLRTFSDRIDAQDWDGLSALLAPDFRARYVHTGETFDKEGFVRLNRDYPGAWRFEHEDVVDDVFHVATFATAGPDGLLHEVVEVWADQVAKVPSQGRG